MITNLLGKRKNLLFGLVFGLFTLAGTAHAATINVPADYATIQAAVNAALPGDTINVAAGTYGQVTIPSGKNGLQLLGAGQANTIIEVADNTYGIQVGSQSVTISGFWIRKTGGTGGSFVTSCADNCGIQFAASGTSGAHTVISNNKIEGFYDGVGGSGGVQFWDITGNTFNNNRTGVFFNTSDDMLVSGNTFSNYFAGTGGTESTSNITISSNTFLGKLGDWDADLNPFQTIIEAIGMTNDVVNLSITGNTISGVNAFGIQVYPNSGVGTVSATITDNSITGTSDFALKNGTTNSGQRYSELVGGNRIIFDSSEN